MSRTLIEANNRYSFPAGADITFNKPVALSSGTVIIATGEDILGVAYPDDQAAVVNAAEKYVAGDMVLIELEGPIMNMELGGIVAAGAYVKVSTGGKLVAEATPTTRTVNTKGIALEAGVTDGWIKIVRLS